MAPKLIFHSNSELLEGPVFDFGNHLLYFVSILDGLVYCLNSSTNEILSVKLDSPVGCIFIVGKKKVVAASKDGFFEVNFKSLQKRFIFQMDITDDVRYNDGIQDVSGRFIIGTMGYPVIKESIGKVLSYHNGQYTTLIENTTISNGLAFSHDNTFLYFIDTPTKKVAKYAYDVKNGEVNFESYVIEFKDKGSPDGMTMDGEGMLWIAEWGGGCVSRWNPFTGDKMDEKKLPCPNVSSCCLDNESNLYVTTAKSDAPNDVYGGGLYYIDLNKI